MRCYICGRTATDTHHIFEGRGRRQMSDDYGLTVRLCRECHNDIHAHPRAYLWLKQDAQRWAMRDNGWTVQDFIDHFGKNYLMEDKETC